MGQQCIFNKVRKILLLMKKYLRIGDFKNLIFLSRPFWISFFKKKCFIPMKISPNLYDRMNGSKFWCFPWFPWNSLLCVILPYTVWSSCPYAKIIPSWENHFGRTTVSSLIYFLNHSLLWYLAQSQILGMTLYKNIKKH